MAKKKVKKTKPTKKAQPVKGVPYTELDRCEQIIFFSKRAMDGTGGSLDEFMQGQIDRAQKRIEELKSKK